jgi:hypothetical protein
MSKASDEYLRGYLAATKNYAVMSKWQLLRVNLWSQVRYIEGVLQRRAKKAGDVPSNNSNS